MLLTEADARTPSQEEAKILGLLNKANDALMDTPLVPLMLVEDAELNDTGYAIALLPGVDAFRQPGVSWTQMLERLADVLMDHVMSGATQDSPLPERVKAIGVCYGARMVLEGESPKADELVRRAAMGGSIPELAPRDGGDPVQQTMVFHVDGRAFIATKSRNGGEVPDEIGTRVFYAGDDSYPDGQMEAALKKMRDAIVMERR